jgi:hypothetical protein
MLRVHFLNVGHGDCTIISHPSGRLTMIDINNSQDYDPGSFNELLDEEKRKRGVAGFATADNAGGWGGLTATLLGSGSLAEVAKADAAQRKKSRTRSSF